jgi:hypothetical protein
MPTAEQAMMRMLQVPISCVSLCLSRPWHTGPMLDKSHSMSNKGMHPSGRVPMPAHTSSLSCLSASRHVSTRVCE